MRKTLVLLLLAFNVYQIACQQDGNKNEAEPESSLRITAVTMADLTKAVDTLNSPVSFVDIKPVDGPLQADYGVTLKVQNIGKDTLVMQSLALGLYPGLVNGALPAAPLEGSSNVQLKENMPNLETNQEWPNGPLKMTFPASIIPVSTSCEVFDITVAMNATFLERGVVTRKQQLVPVKLTPNCLNTDVAPPVTASTGAIPVKISSSVDYVEVTDPKLPFLIDFGEKVLEENPLKLFNVTGSNRTDVVYEVEEGKIYLMVYPDDDDKAATIKVTVPASRTTNAAGVPNAYAEYSVEYVPKDGVIKQMALVLTAIFAGVIVASWITSFIVSCMQPWATAGSLGYGALGFILWAQKLHMTGLIATPTLPADYRTLADAFAWANFHLDLPWDFDSEPSSNITAAVSQFEAMAVVAIDNGSTLLYYDGPDSDPNVFTAPAAAPGLAPAIAPVAGAPTVPASPTTAPAAPVVPDPGALPAPTVPTAPTPGNALPLPDVTIVGTAPSAAPSVDFVPAAPDSCSVFPNTDFFQGDLNNTSFATSDPNACCSACLNEPNCYVWTLHAVLGKCYLKASKGWLQRSNMTCCISGTANRNGLSSILPGGVGGNNGGGNNNNDGGNNNNDNNNDNNKNDNNNNNNNNNDDDNNNNNNKNNRRLLIRSLQQATNPATAAAPSEALNSTMTQPAMVAAVNKRYVLLSIGPQIKTAAMAPIIVSDLDAWDKARDIVTTADPTDSNTDSNDPYVPLEEVAFWFGLVFAIVCLFNLCGWMFVNCCEGELPGVLHVPRMQMMLIMFSLCAFALEGAFLFSGDYDLVPMCVGIAIVVCIPMLFLVASYGGIAAALYRKRKAVYLVSRLSIEEEVPHNKWDLQVVARWMGMSLNRGKWRPADPSRKNKFVFRWGPLFEDCRGPLFTRRKSSPSPPGATTMRRMPYSTASDLSSNSGYGNDQVMDRSMTLNSARSNGSNSSRRKVSSVEEAPIANCCGHKIKRSGFQAFGVVVSLLRIVCYALVIGGLQQEPEIQAIILLVISVLYMGYLRLVVPYSRRDEMALEYFIALLDIVPFSMMLTLAIGIEETNTSQINTIAIGMIGVQVLAYCCYLINRMLIIVHAFAEVVCPGCACTGSPATKKSRSSSSSNRRSSSHRRSMSRDMSMTSEGASPGQPFYGPDGKMYYMDGEMGKQDVEYTNGSDNPLYMMDEAGNMVPVAAVAANGMDPRSASRSARAGVALMFPSIAEEGEGTAQHAMYTPRSYTKTNSAYITPRMLEKESPTKVESYPVGDSPSATPPPAIASARKPRGSNQQKEGGNTGGVWDKFWKSL